MGTAQAAGILVHYIELALERSGTTVTPDMRQELNDAIDAFRSAEKAAYELHSQHP